MSDSFYHTLREARIAEVKEELDRVLSQADLMCWNCMELNQNDESGWPCVMSSVQDILV